MLAAFRDVLLENSRRYAFGAATEDDVLESALAYGRAWLAAPAKTQKREVGT